MEKTTILVIDDETNLLRFFEYNVKAMGYDVVTGERGGDFRRLIGEREYATVLLDMMLPDANGMDLLTEARQRYPEMPVILITAYGTIDKAVQAMKLGAFDFLPKPVDVDRLNTIIRNAVEQYSLRREVKTLRRHLEPPREFHGMAGSSPPMVEVYDMIEQVAPTNATVMITGESGTGKELVARAIHALSGRADKPFVAINCAAIPRDLLESELFGHERGSFTGAIDQYQGCFERAHQGTLFLDEICEMDLGLQAKLLRLIQEQVFYRLGGTRPISVNVRILSATNKEPAEMVRAGRFREDLFYRLNVVPIRLPALRERREDIGLIVNKFLFEFSRANGRRFQGFDLKALAAMERYPWAGNVRELRNVIEQIVVLNDGERVTLELVPEHIRTFRGGPVFSVAAASTPVGSGHAPAHEADGLDRIQPFWQTERDQIQTALDVCHGNVQEVARRLEISPATLYRKIEKYGLVK
ncbi:MAG: sigma-54 dependent transcriptional regulator [bacterium]|nr:sigma-54 dependent transcriptional regulator [bacterium]